MRTILVRIGAAAALATGALAGCGGGDGADEGAGIVVTSSIVGDVVRSIVGGAVEVEVVMPPNSDPHDFAPSARQAQAMRSAGVLVTNGLGFEAGLEDTIEAAEDDGVTVLALADFAPDLLSVDGDHHDEEEHAEHEDDGEEHDHGDLDPHVFTDPVRMATAVGALGAELADEVDALDTPAFRERVATYVGELFALDAEIAELVAAVPVAERLLVTNHDVFAYFADRYRFEVVGSVIPAATTLAEPSGGDLAALAALIAERGVPAIFAETSSPARLAEALAAEGQDVSVVELHTESLGPAGSGADTYLDLMRTNAERIVAALASTGAPTG